MDGYPSINDSPIAASHTTENVLSFDCQPPSSKHKFTAAGSAKIEQPLFQPLSSKSDDDLHKNGNTKRLLFIDKICENRICLNQDFMEKKDQNEPILLNEKFEMKEEPDFSPENSLTGNDDDPLNYVDDRTIGLSSDQFISNSDKNNIDEIKDPLLMEVDEIKEEIEDMDVDSNDEDGDDEKTQNDVLTIDRSLKTIEQSEVTIDIGDLRQTEVIPFEIKVEIADVNDDSVSECTETTHAYKPETIDENFKVECDDMIRDAEGECLEDTDKPENYLQTIDESLKVEYDGMVHDSEGQYLEDTQNIKQEINLETIEERLQVGSDVTIKDVEGQCLENSQNITIEMNPEAIDEKLKQTAQSDVMNHYGERIEKEVMPINKSTRVESDVMIGVADSECTVESPTTELESVRGRRDEKRNDVLLNKLNEGYEKINKEEINSTKDHSITKHPEEAPTNYTERQNNDFIKMLVPTSEEVIASLKRRWPDKFSDEVLKQQKIEIVCPRSSCTSKQIPPTTPKKARLLGYVQQNETTGHSSWVVLKDQFLSSTSIDKDKNQFKTAPTKHQDQHDQPLTKTIMWMGLDSNSGNVTCRKGRTRKYKPINLITSSNASNATSMSQSRSGGSSDHVTDERPIVFTAKQGISSQGNSLSCQPSLSSLTMPSNLVPCSIQTENIIFRFSSPISNRISEQLVTKSQTASFRPPLLQASNIRPIEASNCKLTTSTSRSLPSLQTAGAERPNTPIETSTYKHKTPLGRPTVTRQTMQDIVKIPSPGASIDPKTMQNIVIKPSPDALIDPKLMQNTVIEPSLNASIDPKVMQKIVIEPSPDASIEDPRVMQNTVTEPSPNASIDPKVMQNTVIEPSPDASIDPNVMQNTVKGLSPGALTDHKTMQDIVIKPSQDAFIDPQKILSSNDASECVSVDSPLSEDINTKFVESYVNDLVAADITKHDSKSTGTLSVAQRIEQLLEKNSKILNLSDGESDIKIDAVFSLAKQANCRIQRKKTRKEKKKVSKEREKARVEKRIKDHYKREKLRLANEKKAAKAREKETVEARENETAEAREKETAEANDKRIKDHHKREILCLEHEKEVRYFNYEFDLSVSNAKVRLSSGAKEDDCLRMPCYVVMQTMELNKSTDCSKLCRRKVVKRLCQDLIAKDKKWDNFPSYFKRQENENTISFCKMCCKAKGVQKLDNSVSSNIRDDQKLLPENENINSSSILPSKGRNVSSSSSLPRADKNVSISSASSSTLRSADKHVSISSASSSSLDCADGNVSISSALSRADKILSISSASSSASPCTKRNVSTSSVTTSSLSREDGNISTFSCHKTERKQFVMMKLDGETSLVPTKSANSNITAFVVKSQNDADDVISWIKQKHNVVLLTRPTDQLSATVKQTNSTTTCTSPILNVATKASLSSNLKNGGQCVSGNDKTMTHSEPESHFKSSATIPNKDKISSS